MSATSQPSEPSAPNPYQAPHEDVDASALLLRGPGLFWRTYLWIHVIMVAAAAAMFLLGTDLTASVAVVLYAIAAPGIALLPFTPFVILYLVIAGFHRHRSYLVIAAAETVISIGHWFAAWPAIH